MVIFMWCIILLCIVENHALLENPETLSSYPLSKKYASYKDMKIDFFKNCPGFKCASSGLNQAQIDALVAKENEIRDTYAGDGDFANIYTVQWSDDLARLARARNQLSCMLPPTGDTVIYERVENKWLSNNGSSSLNDSFEKYPVAVEVVMSSRTKKISKESELRLSIYEFIEMFNKADSSENPLHRRGGTADMGCSYLMTGNKTHLVDYMVCLYGYLFFNPNTSENMYRVEPGTPCSDCTFYSTFNEIPETYGQRWICGSVYPHTCSSTFGVQYLSKRDAPRILPTNEFDCSKKPDNVLKKSMFMSGEQEVITNKPLPALFRSASAERLRITLMLQAFTLLTLILSHI